jgi:hypothetical protein
MSKKDRGPVLVTKVKPPVLASGQAVRPERRSRNLEVEPERAREVRATARNLAPFRRAQVGVARSALGLPHQVKARAPSWSFNTIAQSGL